MSMYPALSERQRLLDADDLILKAMHLVSDVDSVFDSLQKTRKEITSELTNLIYQEEKAARPVQ